MTKKSLFSLFALVAVLVGVPGTASADIIFFDNFGAWNTAVGGFENILFNEFGLTSTGNPVQGQGHQSGIVLDFFSNEILTTPASGQARIEAQDGSFNNLLVDAHLSNVFFRGVFFAINPAIGPQDQPVSTTFTVFNQFGASEQEIRSLDASGLHLFGVMGTNGQSIDTVSFSGVPATDVRLFRIAPVPEPGSLLLLGSGLALGIGKARRRFQSR